MAYEWQICELFINRNHKSSLMDSITNKKNIELTKLLSYL